jgi:hypothetical protein
MENTGDHCYAISTIQVLGHIPSILARDLRTKRTPLYRVLKRISEVKGQTIPGDLVDDLIRPIFPDHEFEKQQDPEEFFTQLVESWNLSRLFEFELQYHLYDQEADKATDYPFLNPQKAVVLKAPFDAETPFGTPFLPTEIDDHGQKVLVAYKILKPPPVLIYQFMRFTTFLDAPALKINDDLINISDQIDLTHVMVNEQKAKYDLFAIIEHRSLVSHRGHYVAYINLNLRNQWYLFDDWTVQPATDEDSQRALRKAYITVWIRHDRVARSAVGF